MNTTRHVLTIKQVAEFLQVSTDTVYRLATSGELGGRKIGRIWRFPQDAIQRFVQQQTAAISQQIPPAREVSP